MPEQRPAKSKSARPSPAPLPDAELEVLACLWRQGEATARQIRETMHSYRAMAHGSVMSLLKRLQEKGWVSRQKGPVGKAFVYRPTRRPGPTYRSILARFRRRIFGGNSVAMVSNLFDAKPPTQEEVQKLRRLLDELQTKAAEREKKS